MNIVLSLTFIAFFCIDYYLMYKSTVKDSLTERQRAYILSVKSSVTLFFIGVYLNYKYVMCGFDMNIYDGSLGDTDHFIIHLSVLNMISYLIMDCYIGYNKYHKYMCTLSGYTHHIVYTFISILAIYIRVPGIYLLYMIEELPTVLLSVGNYNKNFRSDNLFGLTFFITRILYHMYLTWKLSYNKFFLILGLISLGLHSYWFNNWFNKYFLKRNEKSDKKK